MSDHLPAGNDADLRAAVAALADEWDVDPDADMSLGFAADRLRALLDDTRPIPPGSPKR